MVCVVLLSQALRTEIERLLKRVKEITYEPQLLCPETEEMLSSAAAAGIISFLLLKRLIYNVMTCIFAMW